MNASRDRGGDGWVRRSLYGFGDQRWKRYEYEPVIPPHAREGVNEIHNLPSCAEVVKQIHRLLPCTKVVKRIHCLTW